MSDHVEWFPATTTATIHVEPDSVLGSDGTGNEEPVLVLGGWGNVAVFEGTFEELHGLAQRIEDAIRLAEHDPDMHTGGVDDGT